MAPKHRKLRVYWGKKEKDHIIYHPTHKCDGHLLHYFFFCEHYDYDGKKSKSLIDELEERGFDITSLKFEIALKEKI